MKSEHGHLQQYCKIGLRTGGALGYCAKDGTWHRPHKVIVAASNDTHAMAVYVIFKLCRGLEESIGWEG